MRLSIEDLYQVRGNILLLGETGVGKSFLARTIHDHSLYQGRPFVAVNLATIVEDLLESEIFGHVKGAFTGAHNLKRGLLDKVENGTLFLDEVGELGMKGQKKLLALLDEKKFTPVGDINERSFHGRIIAATNKNLLKMVEEGTFREDLYFRLRIFSYELIPLRYDSKKLEQFIQSYFEDYKRQFGRGELTIEGHCLKILLNYSWPGNMRELKNTLEFMVCLARRPQIDSSGLPEWIAIPAEKKVNEFHAPMGFKEGIRPDILPGNFSQAMEVFEAVYLNYTLKKNQGRINFTAGQLKISKSTLIAKVRKYGINTLHLRTREISFV